MTTYTYDSLPDQPCTEYIQSQVDYGLIGGDRGIGQMDWTGENETLVIQWDHDLSVENKALLDAAVVASCTKQMVSKSREAIVEQIFWMCLADPEYPAQLGRLLNAFDVVPSMTLALDNLNFPLARSRVQKCVTDGLITEADRDLVFTVMPSENFEDR